MRPCALLSPRRARSTPACARVRVRSASSVGSSSHMRLRRPARTEYARRSSRLRSWRLLVHPLFAIFPLLIAKNELLDLARRGLGELGELDGLGGLETGDVIFAEDYDVLVPVPDLYVPVRVPDRHVAGVVPAALESFLRRLLVLEVAFGDHVAVHHDLTHRLPVALHVVHVLIHHAYEVGGRVALTLSGHEARPLVHIKFFPLGMDPARGHRTVGLGETVDVHGTDVQFDESAEQGGRRRGASDGCGYGRL